MESKRKTRTNEVLIDTFFELMKDRPVNSVSVTELCRKAGINRSTFYAKYPTIEDLKDAAFDWVVRSLFDDAVRDIPSFNGEHIAEKITRKILSGIKNDMKTFKKINEYNRNILFFNSDSLVDRYLLERCKTPGREVENDVVFFKNGLNGIINDWIRNNCRESVDDIAFYVVYIMHKIFDEVWY